MKTIVCPVCHGTGRQTIKMQELGKPETKTEHQIDCVWCDGKGTMTEEQKDEYDYYNSIWCECGHKHGVRYIPDNTPGAAVAKHHYVCNLCNKVVQIG